VTDTTPRPRAIRSRLIGNDVRVSDKSLRTPLTETSELSQSGLQRGIPIQRTVPHTAIVALFPGHRFLPLENATHVSGTMCNVPGRPSG
jgi:hypothetical protein